MSLKTLQNQTFGINVSDRKCVFLLAQYLCAGAVTLRQATSCAGNTRCLFSNEVFTVLVRHVPKLEYVDGLH